MTTGGHANARFASRPEPDEVVRCPDCGEAVKYDRGVRRTVREVNLTAAKRAPGQTGSAYVRLTEDRHQQALYRLAAVAQYLYDTMNGDAESDRPTPDPLPQMAMEPLREAQRQIDLAIKEGQRTRRKCLGGHLDLVERLGHMGTA